MNVDKPMTVTSGTALVSRREGIDFSIGFDRPCDNPVVATIIIPTYQAEATLPRALQSALAQTMREIEVIVADDGSTDSSWRLIEDWLWREPRLRALRGNCNRGKSAIMNCATPFARGKWVGVLDADDWYHPDRFAALVTLGEASNATVVADNQFIYDAVASTVVGPAWPVDGVDWELTLDDYLIGSNVYDAFNLGMLKPLLRTDFVRSTGLRYADGARLGEDFFYLLDVFLRGGKTTISNTPYYFYTQPFGTISRQWSDGARRRYDFQMAYDANQTYLRRNAGTLIPRVSRHLKARGRRFASLEHYFRARDLLDRRAWPSLVGQLIRHPTMLNPAIRHLMARHVMRSPSPAVTRVADQCRQRSTHDGSERARNTRRKEHAGPAVLCGFERPADVAADQIRTTRGSTGERHRQALAP
jgi:succinoglycan biosynthesis protein ExoO